MLHKRIVSQRFAWVIGLCLCFTSAAFAQFPNSASNQQDVHDYYTLDENQGSVIAPRLETPDTYFLHIQSEGARLLAGGMSLLKWVHHEQDPAAPTTPYNRKGHFGTWVNDPGNTDCFNTRAKVLIRDSQRQVEFTPNNHCVVSAGLWKDPYTGELFESARQVQIDHVVPLKHAYISGAWAWEPKKRCVYANFTANNFHLLAVSGRENMRKGDRGPDGYMPPNHDDICPYLESWLKIKMIWGLMIWPDEASAIVDQIKGANCPLVEFQIPRADVMKMRDAESDLGGCANFSGDSTTQDFETLH